MKKQISILIGILFLCGLPFSESFAQHKGLSFQAVLKDPEGQYPTASGLTVTLQILDPALSCVLREEVHSGVSINEGYLNIVVGSSSAAVPVGSNPSPVLSLSQVMDNSVSVINGFNCTYSPASQHGRKLRLKVSVPKSSGGLDLVEADFNMRAVAYAVNSETLNGKTQSDFVNINNTKNVTQENIESIFERFTKLDAILNNSNAAGTALGVNITGNAATATTITGGVNSLLPSQTGHSGKYLKTDGTNVSWETASGGGSGTLTSVGMSLPGDVFQVTGSPLTSDGSISASFKNQTQKQVFASPNAADGVPVFRSLLVSDISNAKSAALYDVPVTGDAGTTQVVKGDDSRLTNTREPIDNSVTTAKIANGAVTDAKIDTVSGSKITGTVGSGALPVASDTTVGIVNIIAQTFKGVKTFIDNVIMQGNLTVSGAISSASLSTSGNVSAGGVVSAASVSTTGTVSADRIKVANSSATCDSATEGSLKYNSASKKMEYCNGTAWTQISQGTLANLSIGAPSSSLVKSGPVTFDVTYGSGADTATISLDAGDITISGTDTTGCSVTGVTGAGSTRTVTVNGCTGTGTVNISIAAGTANSTTGDAAPAAGPSTPYNVDNTGPTAPTGVSLGTVPSNLTNSPTITYTAASDVGGSTVANHQIKIIKASDSSVIKDWSNHTSGSDVGSLTLATNTEYSVLVRAVDALGNTGTSSSAVNWISIDDLCLQPSPTPGTLCADGTYYLGALGGFKYKTTPGNCTSSATPTCNNQTDGLMKTWGAYGTTTGKTSETDGPGNTTALAGGYGDTHAAKYCQDMTYAGHSDWFLPAKDELNLFWTPMTSAQRTAIGIGGSYYWSSTESSNSFNAWSQRFSDGGQGYNSKSNSYSVRCVRRY